MSQHPPCIICGGPIKRERGEREELWLSRRCCGLSCRDIQRSRTQHAKAAERLEKAVASWTPGTSVPMLAQLHGIKAEKLRDELITRGCDLARARRGRPPGPQRPRRRKSDPPRDFLLERLEAVYGRRSSPQATGCWPPVILSAA